MVGDIKFDIFLKPRGLAPRFFIMEENKATWKFTGK